MIAETFRVKDDIENTIKYTLKGIAHEPGYLENFNDLAAVIASQGETDLPKVLLLLRAILNQV